MHSVKREAWFLGIVALAVVAAGCGGGGGAGGSDLACVDPLAAGTTTVLESKQIDAAGGAMGGTDGVPGLVIPPGALDREITIRITSTAAPAGAKSQRFGFEPAGLVFAKPIDVSLPVPAGTTSAFVWWTQHGCAYEPVGGVLAGGYVRAKVTHFSGGYVADETPTRTVTGAKVVTRAASTSIENVAQDLRSLPVAAYVRREGGGYDVYPGQGYSDGTFRVAGVPVGTYLLKIGTRWVETSESVVDAGFLVPGRRGLVPIDLTQSIPVTFDLTGLAPWRPASASTTGLGDRIDVFSGDADTWVWNVHNALPLAQGSESIAASGLNFLAIGTKKVPVYAVEASKGDRLVVAQQSERTSANGVAYQAMSRVFEPAGASVLAGTPLTLQGAFTNVSSAHGVSVDWDFPAFTSALLADQNPRAQARPDTFANRFRIVGQAGGLAYGTHELIGKADFLTMPVDPAMATSVSTGAMAYGTPLSGSWGAHWIATADRMVPVFIGGTERGAFVSSIRSMGAIGDTTALTLTGPALTLPRNPRIGAESLLRNSTEPLTGVGPTPTLSWDPPATGTPDGYSIMIVRLIPSTPPAMPWSYDAILDTAATSLELPPGVLQAGHAYVAIIRAYRRGVKVEAPLRVDLPLDLAIQVTDPFTP